MLAVRPAVAPLAQDAVVVINVGLLGLTLLANGADISVGTMVASIAGLELALLVSLARLLVFASVDLRRKIAVRGLHPLALANYGHRRKIVVSVGSDCDHRRKIVVSGRRRMLVVVVLLLVVLLLVPRGRVAAGFRRRRVVIAIFA